MSEVAGDKVGQEGVFFVWQDSSRGPVGAVVWGDSPVVGKGGDRPKMLAVNPLAGELLQTVEAAAAAIRDPHVVSGEVAATPFPWEALRTKFPPPAIQ